MLYFNDNRCHKRYNITGAKLVKLMSAAYEAGKKRAEAGAYHCGPAMRAKRMAKRMERNRMPKWASERGHRFISRAADAGYGAHRTTHSKRALGNENPYMDCEMQQAIEKQDAVRKNRLMSEMMHRACCAANFNEFDTDLALPGAAQSNAIVSVAGTRSLGWAPQIPPPSMIRLECKYQMGDKPDMPIELDP
jgi:hypothetical protein